MAETGIKDEARRMVDALLDDASWEDLMYRIYVRQAINAGLDDGKAGNTLSVKEVRARFGLKR